MILIGDGVVNPEREDMVKWVKEEVAMVKKELELLRNNAVGTPLADAKDSSKVVSSLLILILLILMQIQIVAGRFYS